MSLAHLAGCHRILAAIASFALTMMLGAPLAFGAASPLTPFPEGDRYRFLVIGDSLAAGLADGLRANIASDPGAEIIERTRGGTGLVRSDWNSEVKEMAGAETFHGVVVMLGSSDRRNFRGDSAASFGTDEWRKQYVREVDQLIATIQATTRAIYFVGLPVMRGEKASDLAQIINPILRERSALNGARFVDTYQAFSDQDGNFSEYGPDMAGKVRRLRERDGVHFTSEGYEKLAHFVVREMRRDMAIARAERDLPLAGDEDEQAQVRRRVAAIQSRKSASDTSAGQVATGRNSGDADAGLERARAAASEVKADNSRIQLRGADGKAVEIEISRPAIPGAVISHIRRTSNPSRPVSLGRTVAATLPGGLVALGSIAALPEEGAVASQQRGSLTQGPYYKVLVKGEALEAPQGRADDFSWPRPGVRVPEG